MNKKNIIITISVVIIAILTGVCCYVILHQKNNNGIVSDTPVSDNIDSADDTGGGEPYVVATSTAEHKILEIDTDTATWKNYEDKIFGFKINYPKQFSPSEHDFSSSSSLRVDFINNEYLLTKVRPYYNIAIVNCIDWDRDYSDFKTVSERSDFDVTDAPSGPWLLAQKNIYRLTNKHTDDGYEFENYNGKLFMRYVEYNPEGGTFIYHYYHYYLGKYCDISYNFSPVWKKDFDWEHASDVGEVIHLAMSSQIPDENIMNQISVFKNMVYSFELTR